MEVKWFESHRGKTFPVKFKFEGKDYDVDEIVYQELREDFETRKRHRIFYVRSGEATFKIIHNLSDDSVNIKRLL